MKNENFGVHGIESDGIDEIIAFAGDFISCAIECGFWGKCT